MKKAKRVLRAVSCVFFGLLVLPFYLFPEYFIFAVGCYFDFELYQFVWIDPSVSEMRSFRGTKCFAEFPPSRGRIFAM